MITTRGQHARTCIPQAVFSIIHNKQHKTVFNLVEYAVEIHQQHGYEGEVDVVVPGLRQDVQHFGRPVLQQATQRHAAPGAPAVLF